MRIVLERFETDPSQSSPLESELTSCETGWAFRTIDHLSGGVAKNGSICPPDICGFEKTTA